MLNYLLSLSYLRQDIKFTSDTNLNQIYADLLDSVHERKYTGSRTHTGINNLEKNNFIRILEEIALVVWHENGRTASIDRIMERCKEANIASYFDEFKGDAESGVIRLLMAFYFREFDGSQGDKTFEFTHKSFGEYLTAKRIMLELDIMLDEVERGRSRAGSGWTVEYAFEKWIKICGAQYISYELNRFIGGELKIMMLKQNGLEKVKKYQSLMIELIQMSVNGQSPIKNLSLSSFKEDLTYSNIAEIDMLIIHSLCARYTNDVIKNVKYNDEKAFDSWIHRLDYNIDGQFNHLDLRKCDLRNIFLGCNFDSTILDDGNSLFSSFFMSTFKNASLKNAKLYVTNFENVDFEGANFENAKLVESSLKGANIKNVCLSGANLERTNFTKVQAEGADFMIANLEDANLNEANFTNANFVGANFKNANLNGTDFTNANLENANFECTNHEDAIFIGSNLKGTILENIYISEEKLEEEK